MTIFEAIILGIVQGLTEFLPVSSSGHLELMSYFFGIEEVSNMQFTVAVHAATVLSTIVVFWRELIKIFQGIFKFKFNEQTLFAINIIVSMIPVAFVGLFFRDEVEQLFTSDLLLVGSMLLVTALLLTFTHYSKPRIKPITPQRAFFIGIAQACAVLPGLSRSGATISTGLLLGVNKEEMAKFSFLMIIVPVLGVSFLDAIDTETISTIDISTIIAGSVSAFIAGLVACKIMIRVVKQGKLIWFAIYCAIVGVSAISTYLL